MPISMRPVSSRGWILAGWIASLTALAPMAARAAEGAIEVNQTCATLSGCTPTDAPGFPITLDTRGSYILTSDLEVPNANTNGIEISGDDVTIDFAGFTLFGPGFVPIATHVCSLAGSGSGILATGQAAGFVARDGRVRGMGKDGINVSWQNARIERMIVERNCGHAIQLGVSGLVFDSQVRANAGFGILVASGSRVRDSVADQNSYEGIHADAGSVVTGCIATNNGFQGISINSFTGGNVGGVLMGNSALANGWADSTRGGLNVGPGVLATQNSAVANAGYGILAGSTAGVGLNSFSANTGVELSGSATVIGCNALDGVKTCP